MVYVATLTELTIIPNFLFCKAQVTLLTSFEISTKYSDFLDVYSSNSTTELLEQTVINDHPINLLNDKQPLYGSI